VLAQSVVREHEPVRLDTPAVIDGGVVRRVLSGTPTVSEPSAEAPPGR
jgi:hypothetical protein